jgi:hypothetical protein
MIDILDESYESDLTEEESERLLLMSEHAVAKPLSPAAQAVLRAYRSSHLTINNLAAALRAAVAHTQQHHGHDVYSREVWECDADELLAIADELEAL